MMQGLPGPVLALFPKLLEKEGRLFPDETKYFPAQTASFLLTLPSA